MKINAEKLEATINTLTKDIREGPYSESTVTIGRLDGVVVRLQLLDPFEAEDIDADDKPREQHDCIQEKA